MARATKVVKGSGNVFADVGIPKPDEALVKAEIARHVNHIIANRKLTQVAAAKILGVPQPRVSDLARGRLHLFSLEKLFSFATSLGNDVEIRMKPSRAHAPRLKVMRVRA